MEAEEETAPRLVRGANLDDRTRPRFLASGATDIGHLRWKNEDTVLLRPELGLFLVADGVSGASGDEGGAVAAQLAVSTIAEVVAQAGDEALRTEPEGVLQDAVEEAHKRICERGTASGLPEMGTTIAALLLAGSRAVIAHVGDSRVYRQREAAFERLTVDHSLVAEWEHRNQQPAPAGLRMQIGHVITRALGGKRPVVLVDVRTEPVRSGDVFVLSSDGLHGLIGDDDMAAMVARAGDLDQAVMDLVKAANDAGGRDNISVVVIRTLGR